MVVHSSNLESAFTRRPSCIHKLRTPFKMFYGLKKTQTCFWLKQSRVKRHSSRFGSPMAMTSRLFFLHFFVELKVKLQWVTNHGEAMQKNKQKKSKSTGCLCPITWLGFLKRIGSYETANLRACGEMSSFFKPTGQCGAHRRVLWKWGNCSKPLWWPIECSLYARRVIGQMWPRRHTEALCVHGI